jgi:hypothetical protein
VPSLAAAARRRQNLPPRVAGQFEIRRPRGRLKHGVPVLILPAKCGRPDPGPASAGDLQAFSSPFSDEGRWNARPAERAQLHSLQQTAVQLLPSSMSRGRDRGAGIVLYASLKTFLLYGKDVFVKRTSKPIGSDRTEARGNYGDSLSSHRYLIGA